MKFIDFDKIIYKQIFFMYLKNCIIYLLALSCIVLLFDYIELFRRNDILTEEGKLNIIVVVPLLNLPSFLYNLAPFIAFFSSFTTYYRLNSSNALCIYRSIGLKATSFMYPIIFASTLIALFNFVFVSYVVETNTTIAENVQIKVKQEQKVGITNNVFWAIEDYEQSYQIAYATINKDVNLKRDKNIALSNVFLATYSKRDNTLITSYSAREGVYNEEELIVYNAYKNHLSQGEHETIPVVKMNMSQNFKNATLRQKNIDRLSPYNLFLLIFSFEDTKEQVKNYLKALSVYISDIFFVISLTVTGAILAFGSARQDNIFISIGKAVLVCFIFYGLYQVCLSFGQSGIISVKQSIIIPIVLITLMNAMILLKKENGY